MVFFSKKGSQMQTTSSTFPWISLTDVSQLDEIEEISQNQSVIIFKHSTRCSISRMVLANFEKEYKGDSFLLYYLDLLTYRSISNEIATRFGVIHQSPQLILIKNKKADYHASHENISAAYVVSRQ